MAFHYQYVGSSISKEEWEAALELSERWRDVHTDESHGDAGKSLGVLARAFRHLNVCYDEKVNIGEEIYLPGCTGPCDGPRCWCVEICEKVTVANPSKKVVFLPDNDPRFKTSPT